jgi:hypothetical protein
MKKNIYLVLFGFISICFIFGNVLHAQEVKVPLSKVPKVVIDSVKNAVPGISLEKRVAILKKGNIVFYEIDGIAHGKKYEIHVDENGNILKSGLDKD